MKKIFKYTPLRLLVILTLTIFTAEAGVMFILPFFKFSSELALNFMDAALLALVILPLFYIYVFRPYRAQIEEISEINEKLQTEVAEHKSAEEAMRQSEERYRLLFDLLPYGGEVLDKEGRITDCSVSNAELFGYERPEMTGRHITEFLAPESIPVFHEKFQLLRQGILCHAVVRMIRKDNRLIDVERAVRPFFDPEGKFKGVLALSVDITERKRMEEELKSYNEELEERVKERTKELEMARITAEAANRVKSEFLANMSHEMRTPMNSIIGFSEVVRDGMAGPVTEEQKDYLNDILESGNHLLRMISDILTLSQLDMGDETLDVREFSVKALIGGVINTLRRKAFKNKISLEMDVSGAEGNDLISADELKIRQVIYNLLDNAIKFTPEGGSVRVSARRVRSSEFGEKSPLTPLLQRGESPTLAKGNEGGFFIEITVEDTGIGISEDDQKRLFQPFQQLDASYTKKYEGTGLGLHLCRKFVEMQGGRIWVESELGRGSRFIFVIPIKEKPASGSQESERNSSEKLF